MLIGIPAGKSKTQYWINQAYVDYVKEAGFEPIMITPQNEILAMRDLCDGLILPGGIDIDPVFYNEENFNCVGTDPEKDDFERQVFYAFAEVQKPIFGICRGLQLIAREYIHRVRSARVRLEFIQHISHHSLTNELSISRTIPAHGIYADKNVLYGEQHQKYQRMFVNSMHHQCLMVYEPKTVAGKKKKINPLNIGHMRLLGLTSYGMTAKEKGEIVEAFEINGWFGDDSRITAVQWHPEELKDYELIKTFFNDGVEAAEEGAQ